MYTFMHSGMTWALELKRMLTNIHIRESQQMDAYLQEIKSITKSLASVNSPIPPGNLVHHTVMSLGCDYETLETTLT